MKLQAKDFRIGNFVEYDNRVFEIDSISNDFPTLNSIEFGVGVVDWNNLQPITLTENWLLDFGFELYDYEPNEESDECPDFIYMSYKINPPNKLYYYTITNTPGDGGYFDFCIKVPFAEYVMLNSIQYVHQLQNLYFALSGEELQIKDNGK